MKLIFMCKLEKNSCQKSISKKMLYLIQFLIVYFVYYEGDKKHQNKYKNATELNWLNFTV